MKYLLGLVCTSLTLMALGCSDENLVRALSEKEALDTETVQPAEAWFEEVEANTFSGAPMEAATAHERVLWAAALDGAADLAAGVVPCLGPGGNPVPGLTPFARLTATGKVFFLDDPTAEIISDQCIVNADGTITITGPFSVTGSQGDGFGGTYTLVQALPAPPDTTAPFTHTEVITHGTGRFAGATGWARGTGEFDFVTATSVLYAKGAISPPRAVERLAFQGDFTSVPDPTSEAVQCVDAVGNPVPDLFGPARNIVSGLAVNLGVLDETASFSANTGCVLNADGTLSAIDETFVYTGAGGDALFGTTQTVGSPAEGTASGVFTITGGAGRFLGATGSFIGEGMLDPTTLTIRFDVDGWIYRPR